MNCSATKKDGSPCKAKARESGLCVFHGGELTPTAVQAPVVTGPPAKIKGMRRARNIRVGIRSITMLRPICGICQDGEESWGWWESCEHDPYLSRVQETVEVPQYSEPLEDGSRIVESIEERVHYVTRPNWVEATVDLRVNSGRGVEKGRRKGWIMPSELRSPLYPNGIADTCEFRSCKWQEGLVRYATGTFCREREARMVGSRATDANGNLIHGAMPANDERRLNQFLSQVPI